MPAAGVAATAPVDASLRALEAAKWHPAAIGRDSVVALFADEMLSVEYGAEPMGLVARTTATRQSIAQIYDVLNATSFTLTEWRTLRPNPDVVLLSYRVSAPALAWTAYATSVWARQGGRWQTVFYQASRARPAEE